MLMFYKLSNTANQNDIKQKFNVTLKYPDLYKPNLVINGLGEDNLHVVTSYNPRQVTMAIWGVMPNNFKEEWTSFQNVTNTLNLSLETIKRTNWIFQTLAKQRCLIIVTGYFTYFIQNGNLYPYYVSLESGEPFYLAGVYSELQDGFLSCGLITTEANDLISKFHNVDNQMPLAIPESIASDWLSPSMEVESIEKIIEHPPRMTFRANPIAKEFFEQNIVYESILQPVHYDATSFKSEI